MFHKQHRATCETQKVDVVKVFFEACIAGGNCGCGKKNRVDFRCCLENRHRDALKVGMMTIHIYVYVSEDVLVQECSACDDGVVWVSVVNGRPQHIMCSEHKSGQE